MVLIMNCETIQQKKMNCEKLNKNDIIRSKELNL